MNGFKNWKNAITMLFVGVVAVSVMVLVPTGIIFGIFGFIYLLNIAESILFGSTIKPFTLDVASLFVGTFTGSGISFIWCMWVFKKAKLFKEKEKKESEIRT